MVTHHLIGVVDVFFRRVVATEQVAIQVGVLVARLFVFVETQRLVVADGEGHVLGNVGFKHLRTPPAMIHLDQRVHQIVGQTREDDFVGHAGLHGTVGALQTVVGGAAEALIEKVEEGGLLRHLRQNLNVGAATHEQIAHAPAIGAGLNLRFHFSHGGKFLRHIIGHCVIQSLAHRVFDGVCLGLIRHQTHGSGTTQRGNEQSSIQR